MASPKINLTQVASSTPFDNTSNGFNSINVQDAIEEALSFDPQISGQVNFDDFDGRMSWSPSTTGVGSSASVGGGNATLVSGKHNGVASLLLGDAVPASASLVLSGTLSNSVVFGNGPAVYKTLIYIPTLATVTDDYIFRCGLGTSTNADHQDGVYFEYDRSQSVNWRLKTTANSTRTVITTSTSVVAASWVNLSFVCNSSGNSVEFFINDASVGTITTNIPITTGRGCGPNFQLTSVAFLSGSRQVLQKVDCSGDNIARYDLLINGITKDLKRTEYTRLNETFEFAIGASNGLTLNLGDIITLKVIHFRPSLGEFNGRIQVEVF